MKKLLLWCLILVCLFNSLTVLSAEYNNYIDFAKQSGDVDLTTINEELIYIAELRGPEGLILDDAGSYVYVIMPKKDSADFMVSYFETGEYKGTFSGNAPLLENLKYYDINTFKEYLQRNGLSDAKNVKAVIVTEGVYYYVYRFESDGIKYVIPFFKGENSDYNITENPEFEFEIGKAYTAEEFVDICEKAEKVYSDFRKEERENEQKVVVTTDDNGDKVVENQETEEKDDNETDEDNAQDKIIKDDPKLISFIDDMTLETTITVSAYSRREKVYYTYDLNSYSELFDEAQNKSRLETVKKVYKKLLNMIDFSNEISMPVSKNTVDNYYASFKLTGSKNVEIKLYDNKISIGSQAFHIDNPEEITKYIETLKYNELKFFGERLDYVDFGPSYLNAPIRRYTNRQTNQVAEYKNGEKVDHHSDYCKREELYFDVTLDSSYYNTILEDVSQLGTEINCMIERMTSSKKVFTKLTMKGNKKEIVLWGELPSNSVATDTLEFSTGAVIDDGYWYEFDANRKLRNHTIKLYKENGEIKFKIELNNDNLTEYGIAKLKNPNRCTVKNVNIKYLGNNYELVSDKTSMIYGFDLSDVAEYEENTDPNKPQLPQDPEYYVSHLKSIGDYGDVAFDVEVRYAASMKLDEYKNPAGWCTKLGDDIEVTLVGMLQTLYGSPRMTYPMIRFKGSKGTIWFDSGTIMQGTDKDVLYPDMSEQISEDRMAYVSFHSLISFEDKVRIRNTVEYDRLEMYMTFTDETRTELESIKLKLPGKNITIKVEDMNYIGGGEHGYESWL